MCCLLTIMRHCGWRWQVQQYYFNIRFNKLQSTTKFNRFQPIIIDYHQIVIAMVAQINRLKSTKCQVPIHALIFIGYNRMKKSTVSIVQNSQSRLANSNFNYQEYERPGVSAEQIREIKEVFDLFDSRRSGIIRPKDLQQALGSLGSEASSQPIYLMITDLLEEDRDQLDFNEFLDLITQRVSSKDTREDLKKVFSLFDDEKAGFISIKNLKRVIKDLGENIDEVELQEMIEKADQDHDGLVSEEEFYNIMTRRVTRS